MIFLFAGLFSIPKYFFLLYALAYFLSDRELITFDVNYNWISAWMVWSVADVFLPLMPIICIISFLTGPVNFAVAVFVYVVFHLYETTFSYT